MDFTPAQHQAIHLDDNLIVTAGAGSGKTRVLVERYLRLLTTEALQDDEAAFTAVASILAITFTEKAAREMRERVQQAVEKRSQDAPRAERPTWEARRSAIEAARIGTIHSFCATLLRSHPAETGLDPHFRVLDEVEALLLLAESVDTALAAAVQSAHSDDPDVTRQTSDLALLLAEAGREEVRTILTGMVRGGAEVRAALAHMPTTADALHALWQTWLTTTRANVLVALIGHLRSCAASVELDRLAAVASDQDLIGKQVRAVHNWLAQLPCIDVIDGVPENPTHISIPDFTPIQTIKLTGGSKKNWPTTTDLEAAKDALRVLRTAYQAYQDKDLLELTFDPELEQRAARIILALRTLYRQAVDCYTQRKEQIDALDYDDLEQRARTLLEQHPQVCARWQTELRAVLVDEFQDTNDEQRAIIYALMGMQNPPSAAANPSSAACAPPMLFVVGDGKQSIYRFRGADVRVFRRVASDIVARGGQAVALDTSFRSHAMLLTWINQVSTSIFARPRPLRPYEIPFETLHAHRPAPMHPCCVEVHLVTDTANAEASREAEARALVERIQALVTGAAGPLVAGPQGWRTPEYGDFALLFQASTVFDYYEQALRAAGIPFLTTAGRGYYGRKEVLDLIHLLRVLDDPADELALVGVLRSPLFALDDGSILRLRFAHPHSLWAALMERTAETPDAAYVPLNFARTTLRDLHDLRGRVTVVELLRAALAQTGYLATISGLPDGERRRVNVEKLLEAARRVGSGGLGVFRVYLDNLLQAESREGEAPLEATGSVQLMTVHRSKGLEFPIVVLPDLGRKPPPQKAPWLARRPYGLALQLRDATGEQEPTVAYQLALAEERQMEQAERERLLYVALTRARDYLLLSGPAARKSGEDWLSRLMCAAGWPWEGGGPAAGTAGCVQVFYV